jgi:hypothetical protein
MMRILAVLVLFSSAAALAHDRHYAIDDKMLNWFKGLKSANGPCCADADGNVVKDSDWRSKDGHYQVFLENQWVDVPDSAVVKAPNLYGPTMVWPGAITRSYGGGNTTSIRCFMPGTMI